MKNVEDVYPLSPMQAMMLFHACTQVEGDVLFNQSCYQLIGPLDRTAFQAAWQGVLDLHPSLRSAFFWKGLKQPQQVVRRKLTVPVEYQDWRSCDQQEQRSRLDALLATDREAGFKLQEAPLMRVTLARTDSDEHLMIWSSHHLIIDRWCIPVVLRDLAEKYQLALAGDAGAASEPDRSSAPYKFYIEWIQKQDIREAGRYWSGQLSGLSPRSPLTRPLEPGIVETNASRQQRLTLEGGELELVRAFCRANRVTLPTLFLAAWSVLLNRLLGDQDILTGVVVSGRSGQIPEVEYTVGSFVNNLPARVFMEPDAPVSGWLQDLQQEAQRRARFEYVSLAQIEAWCECTAGDRLFDTLIVWLADASTPFVEGIELRALEADLGTAYPYTLSVEETGAYLQITGELRKGFELSCDPLQLMSGLRDSLLELAATEPGRVLGQLSGFRRSEHAVLTRNTALPIDPPGITREQPGTGGDLSAAALEQEDSEVVREYLGCAWQDVLDLKELDENRTFFELGGDSIKAARLHTLVQQNMRRSVPLLALFSDATLDGMAATLTGADWPLTPGTVYPIRSKGTLPPLLCIACPGVSTIGYSLLARYLSRQRPVLVVQSTSGHDPRTPILPSELPALAARYVEAMREVQPQGPYYILGMCMGSLIGVEIARQMQAKGQLVAFLGVINTWALFTLSKFYYLQRALNRLEYYRQRVRKMSGQGARQKIADLWSTLVSRLPGVAGAATVPAGHQPDAAPAATVPAATRQAQPYDGAASLVDIVGWGSDEPDTATFEGTLTLFRARHDVQKFWRINDESMGWRKHATTVNTIHLPVEDHFDILREPYVQAIARELEVRLPGHDNHA